jgi:glycosyltransferase involved in cell wall biosynthesis
MDTSALNHPLDTITILQLGSINPARSSDLLLQVFQTLDPHFRLIFQGYINPQIEQLVARSRRKPIMQTIAADLNEMLRNLRRADIGFISLKRKNLNNHFYRNASGQLVEFLRLGIPLVVYDAGDLEEFVAERGCGICIADLKELESAARNIIEHYAEFSLKSSKTYQQYFDIDLYTNGIIDAIQGKSR